MTADIGAPNISEDDQSVVSYFERIWVGRKIPRKDPKFKHSCCNFFEAILQNYSTTNNTVEIWHGTHSNQLHALKPSVWNFIEGLKREQTITELKINQRNAGLQEPREKNSRIKINSYTPSSDVSKKNTRKLMTFI